MAEPTRADRGAAVSALSLDWCEPTASAYRESGELPGCPDAVWDDVQSVAAVIAKARAEGAAAALADPESVLDAAEKLLRSGVQHEGLALEVTFSACGSVTLDDERGCGTCKTLSAAYKEARRG